MPFDAELPPGDWTIKYEWPLPDGTSEWRETRIHIDPDMSIEDILDEIDSAGDDLSADSPVEGSGSFTAHIPFIF